MKRLTIFYIGIFFTIFIVSCSGPFDHDDIQENKIVGNYYILSFVNNSLIYKSPTDSTLKYVILDDVDSIGWQNGLIVCENKSNYYIVDTTSGKLTYHFGSLKEFSECKNKLKINTIILKSTPRSR